MVEKISGILSPIVTDIQAFLLWGGLIVTMISLSYGCFKLQGTSEAMDRKEIIKWMRFTIIAFIGLNLVAWFVNDYLKSAVQKGNRTKHAIGIERPYLDRKLG